MANEPTPADPITEESKLAYLDEKLHKMWGLGRNIILVCTPGSNCLEVMVVPHYTIADFSHEHEPAGPDETDPIIDIITGAKIIPPERMVEICELLGQTPDLVELPFNPETDIDLKRLEDIIKKYSISYVRDRAVALFDIVGFSLYSPLEQVTQLNSLAFSANSAYSKLMSKEIDLQFSRTTTGDGFYIWNRENSVQDNVVLYHFMHLVLADNAIARSKGNTKAQTTPHLRACFHIGDHYEFFQSEGLNPTIYSYIVGDVTIELARMIDQAKPGQVLLGDFNIHMPDSQSGSVRELDTPSFIDEAQKSLSKLEGLELSGDRITSIKCYLTGEHNEQGGFDIGKYLITDKHGFSRYVYNAKDNIYRDKADPIFLGIPNSDLVDFGTSPTRD